ncbi:MAG: GxxExxY protein [Planctomycetota bacterium]|jgi:GxxExxY protein
MDSPHEETTEKILGCAFDVQNTLGCGFLEKVYENAMAVALRQAGLRAAQQVPLRVHYKDKLVGDYIADVVVENAVLLGIKAAENQSRVHVAQVLNYLKASGLPVGMLLNFGQPSLYYRRLELRNESPGKQ